MSQVNNVTSVMSNIDLGPTGSLQFQFAKLQLALAEMSKNSALDYIDQIQKSQEEQKKVSQMLQDARQAQANAKSQGDKAKTEMSPELKAYMDANGLAYDKGTVNKLNDELAKNQKQIEANNTQIQALEEKLKTATGLNKTSYESQLATLKASNQALTTKNDQIKADLAKPPSFTKDEWEVAITSLKAHLDQLGTDTQQKMVFVQDFMGQYNSYLQGANSAIQQGNQTLAELARVR